MPGYIESFAQAPQIVVSGSVQQENPSVANRIQVIDRRIHTAPIDFIIALNLLGETATLNTQSIQEKPSRAPDLPQRPADLILEFFTQRYDHRFSTFDESTEEWIENEPRHTQLLERLRSKEVIANKDSPDARDAVRRSRLHLYISRVKRYREAESRAKNRLPDSA